jgi:transcriptional regulator with XRE-family HTH domain
MSKELGAATTEARDSALIMNGLGHNLKRLRRHRRLSQIELANAAGLSADHISRIERGGVNVRFKTLVRLALALNVALPELFIDERLNVQKHVISPIEGKS